MTSVINVVNVIYQYLPAVNTGYNNNSNNNSKILPCNITFQIVVHLANFLRAHIYRVIPIER